MRPCCVPNCGNKSTKRYAIPSEKRIRKIWIQRVNNPKLFGIEDSRYLKNYVVCDAHFEVICKDSKKLKKFALPTLHLPEYVSEGIEENCFSFPSTKGYSAITPTRLRDALENVTIKTPSFMDSPEMKVQHPKKTYGMRPFSAVASTSKENIRKDDNVKKLTAPLGIAILWDTPEDTCCESPKQRGLKSYSAPTFNLSSYMAKNQSNSCKKTNFEGNGIAIDPEDMKTNTTDIVIKSEDTTVDNIEHIYNDAEETTIDYEETKSDYTTTEISCDETKVDVKDIKLEVQNAASQEGWNNDDSDDNNLKSLNVNAKMKREPQSDYIFVDVENIKQENEDSKSTLVSTFTDTGETRHNEEQFLQCESVAPKSFQCDICNKCFRRLHDLKRHKYIHTGEKRYQCDVCNKSFPQSGALTIHRRQHTGEKPYQCDICSKYFNQSPHLNRHKLTHTGDKPYQCDICNKCFTQSNNLNEHRLTHTGKKPYQCDVCSKCFTHSSNLIRHKYIHSGETPFRCDICNKCFTIFNNLIKHKLVHSSEKPHQ